jgi:hypothetical protein
VQGPEQAPAAGSQSSRGVAIQAVKRAVALPPAGRHPRGPQRAGAPRRRIARAGRRPRAASPPGGDGSARRGGRSVAAPCRRRVVSSGSVPGHPRSSTAASPPAALTHGRTSGRSREASSGLDPRPARPDVATRDRCGSSGAPPEVPRSEGFLRTCAKRAPVDALTTPVSRSAARNAGAQSLEACAAAPFRVRARRGVRRVRFTHVDPRS